MSVYWCIGVSVYRCIGVSDHGSADLAICMDFGRKIGDFEAAPQGRLSEDKGLEASRAKLSYLVI